LFEFRFWLSLSRFYKTVFQIFSVLAITNASLESTFSSVGLRLHCLSFGLHILVGFIADNMLSRALLSVCVSMFLSVCCYYGRPM